MGAWGSGTFENDAARDWVHAFLDGADLDEALLLPGEEEYVDVDDGSIALAAAEVVAAINGHPPRGLPGELGLHLHARKLKPSKRRTERALRAIERVLEDRSELKELWEARDQRWAAGVRSLRRRLQAAPIPAIRASRQRRIVPRGQPEIRTVLELPSPTGAYRFAIDEIDSPAGANTQGSLVMGAGGSGLFLVMGTGLGISARWTGENHLEISIPARLEVRGPLGEPEKRIQHFDQVVNVAYRRS